MKLALLVLLGSGWLSLAGEWPGGTVLLLESDGGLGGSRGKWQANSNAVCRLPALTNGSSAALRYRFAFETEPDETYLLRRQFTCWSNGLAQGSVTLSNLLSGDGITRWETNEVVGRVEQGVVTFGVGQEGVGKFQIPSSKPQESTKPQDLNGWLGVGLTRVTLERYGLACAGCAGDAEPGQPGGVYGRKALRFSLGRTWYGQLVGELVLGLEKWGPGLCQPSGLRVLALPEGVTVVRQGGELRQVGASQCLVDILKRGERQYEMVFYATNALVTNLPAATLFPTNGLTATVRWLVQSPPPEVGRSVPERRAGASGVNDAGRSAEDGGPGRTALPDQIRELSVLEQSGSVWRTNRYSWTDTGWEVLAGNGLRKEVCTASCDATGQTRTELWQTFEPTDNRLVAQRTARYRLFCWGEELVEEVVGVDGEGGTNRFGYYASPGNAWAGRLRELTRSDGSWERFEYDERGRLRTRWAPFANTPREQYAEGRTVSYMYEPWQAWGDRGERFPLRPRTTTESIGGKVVSRSYFIAGADTTLAVRCAAASQVPFDGPALGTTNRFFLPDPWGRMRLKCVEHPDGTMETYHYLRGPFTTTETHCTGEPDVSHAGIIAGSQTLTVLGSVGQVLLQAEYDLAPGRTNILLQREAYTYPDPLQRSCVVEYLDGTSNAVQYACCGLDSWRDRDGVQRLYGYDGLKRVQTVLRFAGSPEPVTTRYGFDAANQLVSVLRVGKGGTNTVRLRAAAYDTAGRVRFETNGLGGVTRFASGFDAVGRRTSTREYPDGGRRIERFNRDGTLHDVSGSAVHGLRYEYGVNELGWRFAREIKLSDTGEPTREWVAEVVDLLGREVKTEYPDGACSQQFYNAQGQLVRERDPDGVLTLYGYNARGERDTEAVRVASTNTSEAIDFGTDRVSRTVRKVMFNPIWGVNVERWQRYVWDQPNSTQSNLVTTLERSVDGLRSWETVWDDDAGATRRSEWTLGPDGVRERQEVAGDGSASFYRYRCGHLELFQERDASGSTNGQRSFRYDAHDRLGQESDTREGTLTYGYNDADLLASLTREAPGLAQKGLTTRTEYNPMLQATKLVLPGGQSVSTEYWLTGEIQGQHGWHSFPVAYTCDYAGRVKTMKTWRDVRDTNSASVTVWNYDPQRGWLTQKRYADGTGPDYEHTLAGRLHKRTWAREVTPGAGVRVETLYGYNAAGDLERVLYNDALTPDLQYQYDRGGRVEMVTQISRANPHLSAITRRVYSRSGLLTGESYSAGPLMGLMVTNSYDSALRRTSLTLRGPREVLDSVLYGYNGSAQLKTVTRPAPLGGRGLSATYTYEPGAGRVKQLEFREGDATRLVYSRRYDAEGRPLSAAAAPSGSPGLTFEYAYDAAGQPTRATLTDCSYWVYRYDPLGELRRGMKYRSDQSPVAEQQFVYDYDDAGRRVVGPSGEAAAGNTGGGEGHGLERWRYDADGNLSSDGRWAFTWDAENRLVEADAKPRGAGQLRLNFAYDWRGRRVQKQLSAWNVAHEQYERVGQASFVYDDWNLLAVLNPQRALVASFTWGLDLNAGPVEVRGAGAGGLLLMNKYPEQRSGAGTSASAPETYFAAFDGHGNLVGLVSAKDGKTAAQYDYGPFGEVLPETQAAAMRQSFRFLTRYEDEETGFLYCGYRYYDPRTGRWLSREPLHEYAFWKLNGELVTREAAGDRGLFGAEDYVYLANAPVGNIDALGLVSSCDEVVQKALRSRGSRRLLQMIRKGGFPSPRVAGSDIERYCSFPGYLGDYDCSRREGKICCGNIENDEQVERTTRHELVHALDCCRNGLETCHDHVCSEVMAYYTADCERFVNRLECALGQMRASLLQDPRCGPEASAMTQRAAWQCVREWKKREGNP